MSSLRRELGTMDAAMMGMGSIIGTGIFVSIGIAAGVAGPAVLLAVVIGAAVATANGLSSAQLAANHPVSGGTYEYGYRVLSPALGFTAGWMFLIAKSASAATAALGAAGYFLALIGAGNSPLHVPLAVMLVLVLMAVILGSITRSSRVNIAIVSVTLASLVAFILAGIPMLLRIGLVNFTPFFHESAGIGEAPGRLSSLLNASALMFVAYTGYGRIATLGEEVRTPRTTIPRAIILALVLIMILYVLVTFVAVGSAGADVLGATTAGAAAPLITASRVFAVPALPLFLTIGAVSAMTGVLLNLILGLSRVLLAMGRRKDMPVVFGKLDPSGSSPTAAVIAVTVVICALALIGNVRTTWSFSAFTVLVYYAITNLAALRIPRAQRLFPRWIPAVGFASCLSLAFFVETRVWLTGLLLIAAGLLWYAVAAALRKPRKRR